MSGVSWPQAITKERVMRISLTFEAVPIKNIVGKRTGKYRVTLGDTEVYGSNRLEIARNLAKAMTAAMRTPEVAIVKVAGAVKVVMHHGESSVVFRDDNEEQAGVSVLNDCSLSNEPLKTLATSTLLHMCQQQWDRSNSVSLYEFLLKCGATEEANDFQRWVAGQIRYRNCIDAGGTEEEAHRLLTSY